MDHLPLIASIAGNIVAGIALPWLAAKLVSERASNTALRGYCFEHEVTIAKLKPDADRGKRSRLQAAAALVKANRVNRERIAAKVAAK